MIFHDNAPVYAPADARRQSGASSIHQANKLQYKSYCDKLRLDAANLAGDASKTFFSADAQINISAPFDLLSGSAGMIDTFFQPLLTAMPDLYRRTDLLFAGHAKGGDWVTGHGHYAGHSPLPALAKNFSSRVRLLGMVLSWTCRMLQRAKKVSTWSSICSNSFIQKMKHGGPTGTKT
jgi:hypothetical protein